MRQTIIYILFYILFATTIDAQWSTDYKNNLQLTNWSRLPLSAASDGKGGVFIAIDKDIYDTTGAISYSHLFRIDKYGYKKWNEPIHLGKRDWQDKVELIEDGSGGVIAGIRDLEVTWDGLFRLLDYKIRVQKIDSNGNKLWGDGVLVSTDTTQQYDFYICTDGNGGCYVSWLSEKTMDYINSDGYRAIQHISKDGKRMWGDTGKVLFTGEVAQYNKLWYQIVPNGIGGLYTISTPNLNDFYYLNIDSTSNIVWETLSRFDSFHKEIYSSEYGNLLTFALKWDSSFNYITYEMDRITRNGEYVWDNKKVFVDSIGEKSKIINLYENEDSTVSVYWIDRNLDGSFNGNYYQLVSGNGEVFINKKGTNPFDSITGGSAMIKSFEDNICISGNYAQKLTTSGKKLWGENGIQFSFRLADYDAYVSDTRGGFIKVWIEGLNGLWAQQVSKNGNLGEVITSMESKDDIIYQVFNLFQNYPNPFNPSTTINYSLKEPDFVHLKVYDVLGKEITTLVNEEKPAGNYSVKFNGNTLSSGVYFYTLRVNDFLQNRKMILLR